MFWNSLTITPSCHLLVHTSLNIRLQSINIGGESVKNDYNYIITIQKINAQRELRDGKQNC